MAPSTELPERSATVSVRPERETDANAVRDVHTRAFADGGVVAGLVDVLRARTGPPPLGLVAVAGERVVGHVLLSTSRLDAPSRLVDVLVLSPLAVTPEVHRQGIGGRLVEAALAAALDAGAALVFVEGDPAYYGPRGFRAAEPLGFRRPSLRTPSEAFQVALLPAYEPWMSGTLVYPEVFWDFDLVGRRPPQDGPVEVHQAGPELLPTAGRLLDAFNREFGEATPGPGPLSERLAGLVTAGDTAVLVATQPRTGTAVGVGVLRFRPALWSADEEAHLAELYVVPHRRGQGVGSALLAACLDHARGAATVDLSTSEDDVAARHLYERFGFGRTEGRPGPLQFTYERDLG